MKHYWQSPVPRELLRGTAEHIVDNGYLSKPIIRGELADFGCALLEIVKERLAADGYTFNSATLLKIGEELQEAIP